jgi:hypothetical protein
MSELRCLLFDISSVGYLIICSLSLVLVPPSGYGALISFHRSLDRSSKFIDYVWCLGYGLHVDTARPPDRLWLVASDDSLVHHLYSTTIGLVIKS